MLIKSAIKSEAQAKYFTVLGGAAQLALAGGILLERLSRTYPALDFIAGMLIGFSLVGSLAYLIYFSKKRSVK